MRNNQEAERIADDRQKVMAVEAHDRDVVARKMLAEMRASEIGPPKPVGSRIHPVKTFDWGLIALRNKCYARLRTNRQGA